MTNLAVKDTQPDAMLPADPMVSMIERVAMSPDADIEKLDRMLQMKERMDSKAAETAHAAAFAMAAAEMPTVPLNGKGHNNKSYAELKDIVSVTRPVLSKHGLALNFDTQVTGQDVIVTARLSHQLGHVQTTSIALPRDTGGSKNAVQAVGSSQTYGQRYTAQAILGLSLGADVEDDGRSTGDAPSKGADRNPWVSTILGELPDDATDRDKAEAVADAICAQWKRKKTEKEINNEWDRRDALIEAMRDKHTDLFHKVSEAFDTRMEEIAEAKAEKERMPV